MSLLLNALKRAQQSTSGATQTEPPAIAPLENSSSASSRPDQPANNQAAGGGIAAARSILSVTARKKNRITPVVIAGAVILIAGGLGGWFYLQSQLGATTSIALSDAGAGFPHIEAASNTPPALPPQSELSGEELAASAVAISGKPSTSGEVAFPLAAQNPTQPNNRMRNRTRQPVPAKRKSLSSKTADGSSPAVHMLASANLLKEGYTALSEGRLADAEAKYLEAIAQRPHEKDALLGLAVIAQRKKQTQRALDYYQQVLSEDPNNITAATALFALSEQADPASAESRLRQLLELKPSAPEPHYALGNVLARQHRWGEAQQSFFRAFSLKPDDAMYAFNLAVAFDHLHKPGSALAYYEKAVQLAKPGDHTINRSSIQQRIVELNSSAQPGQASP